LGTAGEKRKRKRNLHSTEEAYYKEPRLQGSFFYNENKESLRPNFPEVGYRLIQEEKRQREGMSQFLPAKV